MLHLDSHRWSTLTHCYGTATDTPKLLHQLRLDPLPAAGHDAEPWFSLWSSLCHQGDVYEASFAALPHLVNIARCAPVPIDLNFFLLPASIEVARRNGRGPSVPPDLAEDYASAVLQLNECVARHRNASWDQYTLIAALGAQAVAKGHFRVAEAILNLDDHLIERLIALDFDP